ncbi:MAG: hypothetical protein C0490_10650 [Marivirga sp.]|nr:hypothetical protein [Marivirga sp.]
MKSILLILLLASPSIAFSQIPGPLSAFENLIGGRWETRGTWGDGKEFHQAKEHIWELTKHIMIVKTYDFVDAKKFDNSLRNYGVRAYDSLSNQVNFYEFNSFNSLVSGKCTVEGKNIFFHYDYQMGDQTIQLTDSWVFVNKDTYEYKIGIFSNGDWKQVFLSTVYNRK